MDDDDRTTPHTSVTMQVGQVCVTIETTVGWTPEMVEDSLIRIRRQIVATCRQLGLVTPSDEDVPKGTTP